MHTLYTFLSTYSSDRDKLVDKGGITREQNVHNFFLIFRCVDNQPFVHILFVNYSHGYSIHKALYFLAKKGLSTYPQPLLRLLLNNILFIYIYVALFYFMNVFPQNSNIFYHSQIKYLNKAFS